MHDRLDASGVVWGAHQNSENHRAIKERDISQETISAQFLVITNAVGISLGLLFSVAPNSTVLRGARIAFQLRR
jgi:hypothetical protein